jgi:hypothetical protein
MNSVTGAELGSSAYPSELGFVTAFAIIISASLLCVLAAMALRTRASMPAPVISRAT